MSGQQVCNSFGLPAQIWLVLETALEIVECFCEHDPVLFEGFHVEWQVGDSWGKVLQDCVCHAISQEKVVLVQVLVYQCSLLRIFRVPARAFGRSRVCQISQYGRALTQIEYLTSSLIDLLDGRDQALWADLPVLIRLRFAPHGINDLQLVLDSVVLAEAED